MGTAQVYKVEPYVMAADVYAVSPHIGRGGWTWYTGSSGWMYRLIVESLLGITLDVDKLHLAPILPAAWPSFELRYRYRESTYLIKVTRSGAPGLVVDAVAITGSVVTMIDDGAQHRVEFSIEAAS
jgi:cyclic beta-1,2-glucan synthetase